MPKVSVVLPVYNVERFVQGTVESVLAQTYDDFELLIIDDGSPDRSVEICRHFEDPRIRIISQKNRGLAGARNTGIRHAGGEYVAFLDADDLWLPEKLARHVAHLDRVPEVGISFSRSAFIDQDGNPLNYYQMPRLTDITLGHLLCRNPVGNGSAPVIRASVLAQIAFAPDESKLEWYFDETLRQSEDIECWIRIAVQTGCRVEGIPEALTLYRVNADGLSADVFKQLASWECVIEKTRAYAPELIEEWGSLARAYQLRYLARRAVRSRDGRVAMELFHRALRTDPRILFEEPQRTLLSGAAVYVLALLPCGLYSRLESQALRSAFNHQQRVVLQKGG